MPFSPSRGLPHAMLVQGALDRVRSALVQFLCAYDIDTGTGDVVRYFLFERCAIDDVRAVTVSVSLAPVGSLQVFVVAFETITVEAQHALLKTLEEPTKGTVIVLVTPYVAHLLPTVRSRLVVLALNEESECDMDEAVRFLEMKTAERLAYVAPLIARKDGKEMREFLEVLLRACDRLPRASRYLALRVVSFAEGYCADRSASQKQILEYIALTLP